MFDYSQRKFNWNKVLNDSRRYYRWILLCASIVAVVLGCGKYVYDYHKYQNVSLQKQVELSDEEKQVVDIAVSCYKKVDGLAKYNNESVIMTLDSANVDETVLVYKVELSTNYAEEENFRVFNLIQLYANYINEGGLTNDIEKKYSYKEDIMELIQANYNSNEYNELFTISIIENGDQEQIRDYIEDVLVEYNNKLNKKLDKHEIQLLESYNHSVFSSKVFSKQQTILNQYATYETRLNNIVNSMNSNQKNYYNKMIGNDVEQTVAQKPQFSIVFLVVGFVLGLFVIPIWIVICMTFSQRIESESDYYNVFKVDYLGSIKKDNFKKVDNTDKQKIYLDALEFIICQIQVRLKYANKNEVALLSSEYNSISCEVIEDIKSICHNRNIEVKIIEDYTKSNMLLDLYDIGNCILLESIGNTRLNQFETVISLCNKNRINVIGVIDV